MKTFEYAAVVWREGRSYLSKCPELGVASCGDTIEEATNNLKEAVELYVENAKELNLLEDIKDSLTTKEKFTANIELVI